MRYDFADVFTGQFCCLERREGSWYGAWVDLRIDPATVPAGKVLYECADHDGTGDICRIQKGVLVDFFGSMIVDHEIPLIKGKDDLERGVIYVGKGDDFFWIEEAEYQEATGRE